MRLSDRIRAIEQRSVQATHGVVVVKQFETKDAAIRRMGWRKDSMPMGCVFVPEKNQI